MITQSRLPTQFLEKNRKHDFPGRVALFTICSNNYMPAARVLMDSVSKLHPEFDLFIGLADKIVDWDGLYNGPASIIEAHTLDIPDFNTFAFQYDIMEFNTAIKPFLMEHLLADQGFDRVFYFDPDILLLNRLDLLLTHFDDGASFLLTPHLHRPAEGDSDPNDITIMRAGVYNLGFLGASRSTETLDVIRWWMRRLHRTCINAQEQGIFVDQKFMDLVPCFAPNTHIIHNPGMNLAYWNLAQVTFRQHDNAWTANEDPLVFFHFSGFDPRHPECLSKHSRHFRTNIAPALRNLLNRYSELLFSAGYGTIPAALYAYGFFTSGTRIPEHVRRMFREYTPDWPSNPFETYEAYLHQPAPKGSLDKKNLVFTNFQHYLWNFFDNQRLNLDPERADHLTSLTHWYIQNAGSEQGLDHRLIEPVACRFGRVRLAQPLKAFRKSTDRADISVVGYLQTTSGVGTVARHTLQNLAKSTLAVEGVDVAFGVVSDRSDKSCAHLLNSRVRGRIQLYANINADQLPAVLKHLQSITDPGYKISMPAWELEEFPTEWLSAFDGVDEIWAQTRWIQRMLAGRLDKPVIYMPVALTLDLPVAQPREHFGLLEDKFLFYFSFDFLSFIERKNPEGIVAAFRHMRKQHESTLHSALVIKTMNGDLAKDREDTFLELIGNDPDIIVIKGVLSRPDTLSLMTCCDCVVSLHRCEGLGLVVAEAMALGLPVIATDYAATTDLLSPATGYPVGYRLVPVKKGEYPFGEGQRWAEPDIRHAAWLMRHVMNNPEEAQQKAEAAQQFIQKNYNAETVLKQQIRRFAELIEMA
ncbi:glycosyltransferase [Gluconobacter cerinus]